MHLAGDSQFDRHLQGMYAAYVNNAVDSAGVI